MKYMIIEEIYSVAFENRVNEKIKEGWRIYGEASFIAHPEGYMLYIQPMVWENM